MQSHQKSFSMDNKQKLLGHRRSPTIGKAMPVTALLMNFEVNQADRDHIARDGVSPEIENPPLFFQTNDINEQVSVKLESSEEEDNLEQEYEILISECNSDDGENIEKLSLIDENPSAPHNTNYETNKNNLKDMKSSICMLPKLNVIPNFMMPSTSSDIENILDDKKSICSECTVECNSNNSNNSVFKQLCNKLCTPACKSSNNVLIKNEGNTLKPKLDPYYPKSPSKLELLRKTFLNEILKGGSEYDSGAEDDYIEIIDMKSNETKSNKKDLRENIMIAEALAKTSMMTSPAAKRRLIAKRLEMELNKIEKKTSENFENKTFAEQETNHYNSDEDFETINEDFVPPRELLLYLVRMGSFNSAPKINNIDSQDDSLQLPQEYLTATDLIEYMQKLRGENPPLLKRFFLNAASNDDINYGSHDITDRFKILNFNNISKACGEIKLPLNTIRILQWNVLSQTLGQNNDGFVCCPDDALKWDNRKYLIVEEILQNNPDVICLQEVDHFKFLERILKTQNYSGIFFPKPDSPCLYIEENNGPDGCAIFYKNDKFTLLNFDTRILEVWCVQSNQVAIVANLRLNDTGKEFTICTTHLKARNGTILSKLRNEQGKDLLRFVTQFSEKRPIILSGDFNAEPIEPVYSTVINNPNLKLSSAYADMPEEETHLTKSNDAEEGAAACSSIERKNDAEILASKEPPYTTWKIREDGEECHTIDYVFYSKDHFKVKNCLLFPQGDEIGKNRTPSFQYPSDHFSLVCDLEITNNEEPSNHE